VCLINLLLIQKPKHNLICVRGTFLHFLVFLLYEKNTFECISATFICYVENIQLILICNQVFINLLENDLKHKTLFISMDSYEHVCTFSILLYTPISPVIVCLKNNNSTMCLQYIQSN